MKKSLSILLLVCMLLSMFAGTGFTLRSAAEELAVEPAPAAEEETVGEETPIDETTAEEPAEEIPAEEETVEEEVFAEEESADPLEETAEEVSEDGGYITAETDYILYLSGGKAYKNSVGTANDITETVAEHGLSYDNGTWTMRNFHFTTAAAIAVQIAEDAKIQLEGDNSVESTFSGSDHSEGIWAKGSLAVSGDGALNVTAGAASDTSVKTYSCGIRTTGALTISGGTIYAAGGTSNCTNTEAYSCGIMVGGALTVSGGTVEAKGGKTTGKYGYSMGIYKDYKSSAMNFTISGGRIEATGGEAVSNSYGIMCKGTLTIKDGMVAGIGGTATGTSYGICSGYTNTISGGNVTATGGNGTGSYGLYGSDAIEISGGSVTTAIGKANNGYGVQGKTVKVAPELTVKAGNTAATDVVEHATAETNIATQVQKKYVSISSIGYTLYLKGGAVYKNNIDGGVLSNTGITYNAATGYTFTNVNFTTSEVIAVQIADETATINLAGSNFVRSTSVNGSSIGLQGMGSLTITGNGSLTVTAGAGEQSRGISCSGDLNITGGTVNANGGTATQESVGLFSKATIEINDGSVSALGGEAPHSYGIECDAEAGNGNKLIVRGGTITAVGKSKGVFAGEDAVTIASGLTVKGGADEAHAQTITKPTQSTICTTAIKYVSITPAVVDYTLYLAPYLSLDGFQGKVYKNSQSEANEISGAELEALGISYNHLEGFVFDNVNFTTSEATAVKIADYAWATITLKGDNKIQAGTAYNGDNSYGITSNGGLTITGTGSLDVTAGAVNGGESEADSCGIKVDGGLEVTGGTIQAAGGKAIGTYDGSYGLYGDNALTVLGGKLMVSSNAYGAEGGSQAICFLTGVKVSNLVEVRSGSVDFDTTADSDSISHTSAQDIQDKVDGQYVIMEYNGVTVTFDSQGGSAVNPQTVLADTKATQPTAPTLTNYVFDGWYKEAACENKWDFDTDTVLKDITLYAKWLGNIAACTINDVDNKVYTGSAIEPDLTVKFGGITLNKGTDYTVSYENNTNTGTATVTITGTGSYKGTKTETFTIAPKQLTVSGTTADGKTYDGTTTAKAKLGTVGGRVGTDDVQVVIDTAEFEDENAGNGKTVTVSYKLTGTKAGNYNVPMTDTTSADIDPKQLTVSDTTVDKKTYDETREATVHPGTLQGVISGESIVLKATGTFDTADVGTNKPVDVVYVITAGNAVTKLSNYVVPAQETLLATIEEADSTPDIGKTDDSESEAPKAPKNPKAPETPKAPDTGDDNNAVLWFCLLVGCGAASVVVRKKRKEN